MTVWVVADAEPFGVGELDPSFEPSFAFAGASHFGFVELSGDRADRVPALGGEVGAGAGVDGGDAELCDLGDGLWFGQHKR